MPPAASRASLSARNMPGARPGHWTYSYYVHSSGRGLGMSPSPRGPAGTRSLTQSGPLHVAGTRFAWPGATRAGGN